MVIKRDSYLNELISRKWNGMIKVVSGMRRSGKSYLLFRMFVAHLRASGVDERNIVTIELDRKVRESKSAEGRIAYLKQVFAKTYLTDVVERNRLKRSDDLADIVCVLASSAGSLTNMQTIADTFRTVKGRAISKNTVAKYVKALENAFLIEKASRYDVKGRKYIGALAKYYFTDVGIRNCVLGFRQQEESHIMENVIYNELRRRGWEVDVGVVETWGKNVRGANVRKQLEIDFVCNKGSRRVYVQSAFMIESREKMAQEQHPFSVVGDSFQRLLIVKDQNAPWQNEKGTLVIGLRDFLLDPSLMELSHVESHESRSRPRTFAVDRNARLFEEVAPDLGEAFGDNAFLSSLLGKTEDWS